MSEEPDKPNPPAPAAPAEPPAAPAANVGDDGHWARPVAQKRDRHVRAWLLMLSLVCFAIAFRGPLNRLYWGARNRFFGPKPVPAGTADCFLALSYEGVSALPDPDGKFTSAARLREHLAALRDAGYHPIGIEDVRAFYREGRKLPDKAVLITFDNTHKGTYFDGAPVIAEFRWRATLGVVTRDVREKSPDSVLAPYLRDLVLDDAWDLACESDSGTGLMKAGPHGRTALALSAPEWNEAENRPERPEEFEARVRADHDRALSVFEKELGMRPIAYFFPVGNYGQYEERNRVLRAVNLRAVSERYDLGFLLGSRALNTAGTDPRRLNRLRVVPEWTAATLPPRPRVARAGRPRRRGQPRRARPLVRRLGRARARGRRGPHPRPARVGPDPLRRGRHRRRPRLDRRHRRLPRGLARVPLPPPARRVPRLPALRGGRRLDPRRDRGHGPRHRAPLQPGRRPGADRRRIRRLRRQLPLHPFAAAHDARRAALRPARRRDALRRSRPDPPGRRLPPRHRRRRRLGRRRGAGADRGP